MKPALRRPLRWCAYGLFCLLDHGCWLLIQVLPGPRLIALARHRPRQQPPIRLTAERRQLWTSRIAWLLQRRCRRAGWGSSCLSRCLSGRLLLDRIGAANHLHLGMTKTEDGRKVPHAWLSDPSSGRLFTPGLSSRGSGAPLTRL